MQAHLLLLAVFVLLVILALQLRRNRSIQTEVAGDPVTLQALKDDLAKVVADLAKVEQVGTNTAQELQVITQVLEVHFATQQQRNEQERLASVCSTGGHLIHRRVR